MGLRATAAADAKAILEDSSSGFGWSLLVTSPAGTEWELIGFATDIGQTIDPDTGQAVAGRRASVAVHMASLPVVPELQSMAAAKPWRVSFENEAGAAQVWKIIEVLPDHAMGVMVFLLEAYRAA
jgi:hypothetical protein